MQRRHEVAAQKAAMLLSEADSLIITAGAGMGIDSGLPDFRGPGGFWGVYPALGRAQIRFHDIANPQAFTDRPSVAWGFYAHRLNLYRATIPHAGFHILQNFAEALPHGAFVFTSNVDGQFSKAGFSEQRIVECHGSIHYLQCSGGCMGYIWPARNFSPKIDETECRLVSDMPTCDLCGSLARPNVLMFGDWAWYSDRAEAQKQHYRAWRNAVSRPVVIELGAGRDIPTVRNFGESQNCPIIRINPFDWQTCRANDVSLACGALDGLKAIEDARLEMSGI